jgi:hypothetical protein
VRVQPGRRRHTRARGAVNSAAGEGRGLELSLVVIDTGSPAQAVCCLGSRRCD